MLFFVVHVNSFERSPDCFVIYERIYKATGFSLSGREPDIENEIRKKRLARRILGRAIVFVFCDNLLWILWT